MKYLRVRNLDKYQHYKKRNPPWVKLHATLLEDYEFSRLQDASKFHAIACIVLASRTQNKIPLDLDWIARRIGAVGKIDIAELLACGFLDEVDENGIKINGVKHPLAECLQSASKLQASCHSQTETETETDKYSSSCTSENSQSESSPASRVPVQKIVDLYHEVLPELPRVEKLTPARRGYIQQRWREDLHDLEHWRNYFDHVRNSDFLMGKKQSTNGKPPFRATLEWLTRPGNFAKVAEDKYHA